MLVPAPLTIRYPILPGISSFLTANRHRLSRRGLYGRLMYAQQAPVAREGGGGILIITVDHVEAKRAHCPYWHGFSSHEKLWQTRDQKCL